MEKPVILFLAANPDGTTRVALDEECAAIEREVKMTPGRDDFVLRSKWAVTVDDVMRELLEMRPLVIHFAGHGNAAGVVLHGKDGTARTVTGQALTAMIASTSKSVRLVVLNACYSEAQAQALSELVGCAVGMNGTVSDDAAREFSVAFYRGIGHRCSAYSAFCQAVATLAGQGLESQAAPRCVTRADVDAGALIVARSPAASQARPPAVSQVQPAGTEAPPEPRGGSIHNAGTVYSGRDTVQTTVGTLNAGNGTTISIGSSSNKRD